MAAFPDKRPWLGYCVQARVLKKVTLMS